MWRFSLEATLEKNFLSFSHRNFSPFPLFFCCIFLYFLADFLIEKHSQTGRRVGGKWEVAIVE